MNPIQMFLRGYKVAISNLAMAWVYLGTILLLFALMMGPLVLGLVFVGVTASNWQPSLAQNWMLWAGVAVVFCAWVSLLLVGWFYVEGGLRGLVAKAHRSAPEDYALKPSIGRSQAFHVFSMDAFWEQCQAHGWRVTVLASVYAGVACLFLLPCFVPLLVGVLSLEGGEPGPLFWVMMGLFGLLFALAMLAVVLLSLHYQVAVTHAVLESAPWRESMRAATRLLKAKPLEFLAVFGLCLGAGMALAVVFMVISFPLAILSVIPGLILVVLPIRIILMLCQWFVQGILQTTMIGAYTAYCAPLAQPASPAAPAPAPAAGPEAPAPPTAPVAPA